MKSNICRVAVFYDGTYFFKVSNYYLYQHERRARLSFKGVHDFILAEVAHREGTDVHHCQIVDAAYFRGRLTAQQAADQDKLFSDRIFEDALMRADISMYQQHLSTRFDGTYEEKRIDVQLALEAYEMTSLKQYDVVVLITGDGDFVPLVKKLNTLGARVMLLGWDFEYERDDGRFMRTQVSTGLIDRVNYPIMMKPLIDDRARRQDPLINALFMPRVQDSVEYRHPVVNPVPPSSPESGEQHGVIINLRTDKGYGFIRPDSGGENCFFHASDLENANIEECHYDDRVSFIAVYGERGIIARNVKRLSYCDDLDGIDDDLPVASAPAPEAGDAPALKGMTNDPYGVATEDLESEV
ncbi:MAG: NYN domain-containing protein [Zoogloeaceae bacterium]|jgi:cold shock CspA family protein/uncharacterized LabA/DUF88 family protein|nr:NYN domain-containing protein [Zoogloeaceae bacterium]